MRTAARCAVAAALVLITWSPRAGAVVVHEDPLSGDSLNLGGTVRSFNYVMHGGPLTGPLALPDADPTVVSLTLLRPRIEWQIGESLRLVVHDEFAATTSSTELDALGGPLALGQGRRAPLWLPMQWTVSSGARYAMTDYIDWAYARYKLGDATFTLGRQPVTFGRAVLWTPVDLLAPFSPIQIDTEFKPGVDAARADFRLSETATLILVGVAGRTSGSGLDVTSDGWAAMPRLELSLGTARVGLMTGYVRDDAVGGGDFFLDIGHGADLHGEATLTIPHSVERRPNGDRAFARAVIGTTFELSGKLHGTVEAYYNGSGTTDPAGYVTEFSNPRFQTGETYNVGVYYGGAAVDWQIHPLVRLTAATLVNMTDPSVLVAPMLQYSVASNAELLAGAFVPIGSGPAGDTASGLVARSEFGLYPNLYHVDLKVYF